MSSHLLTGALLALVVGTAELPAQTWQEEVNAAIDRGIHSLLLRQRADGSFRGGDPGDSYWGLPYPMGVTSLAVYALVNSGLSRQDPVIRRAIDWLRYKEFKKVYSVSCLILALGSLRDPTVEPWIRKAARWLERCVHPHINLWGYPDGKPELSNTQFAVLALTVAEKHGYRVRRKTWTNLLRATLDCQNENGGWGYRKDSRPHSQGTMTTAGITVLALGLKRLKKGALLRRPTTAALENAWRYLDRVFSATGNPARRTGVLQDIYPANGRDAYMHYYYLYGLERIAALCERRRIGGRDWYQEGSIHLLGSERHAGGWDGLANTSFALLFLRRVTFTGLTAGGGRTGYPAARLWRYTFRKPSEDWTKPEFDDAAWAAGTAAFGSFANRMGVVRTAWKGRDIWLRRTFEHKAGASVPDALFAVHDDGAEFYLNGVLVARKPLFSSKYAKIPIGEKARTTMRPGPNVLAVHCHDIGGARIIDVRLNDHRVLRPRPGKDAPVPRRSWWRAVATGELPFVRRWLVLGPLADPDNMLLHESLLPDEKAAPRRGERFRGCTWKEVVAPGGFIDLKKATRWQDRSLFYAFTWLKVAKRLPAVIWLGSDDGVRVYLDGKPVVAHFARQKARPGRLRVPIVLQPGLRRLLVKVEDETGVAGFYLQITRRDGTTATEVLPCLSPVGTERGDDMGELVRSNPGSFDLKALLKLLPSGGPTRLTLARESELEHLVVGPARPRYPAWTQRFPGRGKGPRPAPGATGIVTLWPPSAAVNTRCYRKLRLASSRPTLQVRLSGDVAPGSKLDTCVVRLGIYDGKLTWLERRTVAHGELAARAGWIQLQHSLRPWKGKTVLIVLEVGTKPGAKKAGCVFLDALSVTSG